MKIFSPFLLFLSPLFLGVVLLSVTLAQGPVYQLPDYPPGSLSEGAYTNWLQDSFEIHMSGDTPLGNNITFKKTHHLTTDTLTPFDSKIGIGIKTPSATLDIRGENTGILLDSSQPVLSLSSSRFALNNQNLEFELGGQKTVISQSGLNTSLTLKEKDEHIVLSEQRCPNPGDFIVGTTNEGEIICSYVGTTLKTCNLNNLVLDFDIRPISYCTLGSGGFPCCHAGVHNVGACIVCSTAP